MAQNIRTQQQPTDSHWFVIDGRDCFIPWNWEVKVNLTAMQYITPWGDGKEEWTQSDWPTLNEMKAAGMDVKLGHPYQEYDIDFPERFRRLTPKKAREVVAEFAEHGFHVTLDAVMHNYAAWKADFKSGYRGEDFHLFTPCGCNPLSFRATTLHPSCEDWQTTYMC